MINKLYLQEHIIQQNVNIQETLIKDIKPCYY